MSPLRALFGAQSPVLQSAIVATLAMFLFGVVPSSVRLLSDTMSPFQIVFIRAVFGVVAIGGYFAVTGLWRLKTRRATSHLIRATDRKSVV